MNVANIKGIDEDFVEKDWLKKTYTKKSSYTKKNRYSLSHPLCNLMKTFRMKQLKKALDEAMEALKKNKESKSEESVIKEVRKEEEEHTKVEGTKEQSVDEQTDIQSNSECKFDKLETQCETHGIAKERESTEIDFLEK